MLAKITSKNQLTLPKSVTQAVGAVDYFDVEVRSGQIILTPVRIPHSPPKVPVCRNVCDEPFMHLAVSGKAKVLVSGDRDLLALATAFEHACACPILPLGVFCQRYGHRW